MKAPDREVSRGVLWFVDGLLSTGGHALPAGLMAALREYKSALLAAGADEPWAQPGCPARYGTVADLIEQELTGGKWKPGGRMPSDDHFAEMYGVKRETVARAMHVLTVRGRLALEDRSYYVLPRDMP